jgi:hypothetical protein
LKDVQEPTTTYTYEDLTLLSLAASTGQQRHNLLPYPSFEIDDDSDGFADGTSFYGAANGSPTGSLVTGSAGTNAQRLQYTAPSGESGAELNLLLGGHAADASFAAGDPATQSRSWLALHPSAGRAALG